MKVRRVNLGLNTADAEQVGIAFVNGALVLDFVDWQERPQTRTFQDVLAFRWQEFDERDIRDDTTYEVMESAWLIRQAELQAVPPGDYAHYMVCFNACGVLDILCRRLPVGDPG